VQWHFKNLVSRKVKEMICQVKPDTFEELLKIATDHEVQEQFLDMLDTVSAAATNLWFNKYYCGF